MSTKRVAVIGGGPAGLTAGYKLAAAGVAVDVFESDSAVGGMCRTLDLWGQKVDLGPHRFFSSDKRVNSLWLEVVGDDYEMVSRLTRIHYGGKLFNYPLKAFDALSKLGLLEACHCTASYLKERLSGRDVDGASSFEEWVVSRFGRRLFEIFFKSYSEKLWGISCADLDADFAAQRIKKFSLGEAIRSALIPSAAKGHKTLVDEFAYPHGGTGMVYERLAEGIRRHGGTVNLNAPVRRVVRERDQVTGLEMRNGEIHCYDHVVSTMPLTVMVRSLGISSELEEAVASLKFRNTILVYLEVDAIDLFPDNWLYVHSPELRMGRVTNFRNWVPQILGDSRRTIIAVEYWCYDEDPLWNADQSELVNLAGIELRKTGLIGEAAITNGKLVRIPRCYPVYSKGYREQLRPIQEYLSSMRGLSVIGRYGSFKYNNQDHSILMGLLAAENILENADHDLWEINTDYETYQEEATITRTGLKTTECPCGSWGRELNSV